MQYVRGVGPKKAEALAKIGIRSVEDAVWMVPWRYEDRSQLRSISSLVPGETAMIKARVENAGLKLTHYQRRKLIEVTVADGTGKLHLIWFNQAYLAETFHIGQLLMLYGQVRPKNGRWTELQMDNPVFEVLERGRAAISPTPLESAKTNSFPQFTHHYTLPPRARRDALLFPWPRARQFTHPP